MTNKNGTKRALLTSLLALLLCCSMLVGSTFAWFTDSAVSGVNNIVAGNLDIEVYYAYPSDVVDGDIPEASWKKVNAQDPLFNKDALWEPGYTEAVFLKFVNEGTLALQYQLKVDIVQETVGKNKDGGDIQLSKFINAYACNSFDFNYKDFLFTNRGDAINPAGAPTPYYDTLYNAATGGIATPSGDNPLSLDSWQWLEPKEKTYATLVLWMPTTVGNEANHNGAAPEIDLGITVLATQYAWAENEEDSFDHTYDENAEYLVPVINGSGLNGALENGGDIVLKNDVTTDSFNVPKDTTVNVDLNGNTLSGATARVPENSELNLSGGTIDVDAAGVVISGNATLTDVDMNAGSPADYAGITRGENAVTVYDDVNVASGGGGVAAAGGAKVVFNSGSVEVDSESTAGRYLFYAEGAGSEITINGGNFDFNKTQNQKRAYVYAGAGTTVTINGGTFGTASTRSGYTAGILGDGNIIIKGGTFGFNPSTWVADGYEAVQNGSTWTVSAK